MNVRPLQGRVCVREILPKQIGMIHLPDDYHDNNLRNRTAHRGIVLAMGAPACTPGGAVVTPDFKVGDEVGFVFDSMPASGIMGGGSTEKSRTSVWIDGGPCVWLTQEEIQCVYEETGT